MAASVVVIIAAAQQKYFRAFTAAGATDSEHARTLTELGLKDSRIFRGMVRRGYFIAAANGYYLHAQRVADHRRRARTSLLIAILVVVGAAIIAVLFATTRTR